MIAALFTALLLALSRAELMARFKAPIVTQADGLIKVYAYCPEDMRREYQMPIASFAAETVKTLYRGRAKKISRFEKPGIVIAVGDVRTNVTDVLVSVSTNENRAVTRIRIPAPGYADLYRLKLEVVRAFCRSVEGREVTEAEAVALYRKADPVLRLADERRRLEDWLAGCGTPDDEEGLRLLRKVFEPGKASRRDVLTFASRLYLYPPEYDLKLVGKYDCLSFRDALKFGRTDALTRLAACSKANMLPVVGGGKSPELAVAAWTYRKFALELAKGDMGEKELADLLEEAEMRLNLAYEKAALEPREQ